MKNAVSLREQQVLEQLATWLERFSSFVSIAGRDVLLLEIAGSLRFFGGLPTLRQKISEGLGGRGLFGRDGHCADTAGRDLVGKSGQSRLYSCKENLPAALRQLPLTCLTGQTVSVSR